MAEFRTMQLCRLAAGGETPVLRRVPAATPSRDRASIRGLLRSRWRFDLLQGRYLTDCSPARERARTATGPESGSNKPVPNTGGSTVHSSPEGLAAHLVPKLSWRPKPVRSREPGGDRVLREAGTYCSKFSTPSRQMYQAPDARCWRPQRRRVRQGASDPRPVARGPVGPPRPILATVGRRRSIPPGRGDSGSGGSARSGFHLRLAWESPGMGISHSRRVPDRCSSGRIKLVDTPKRWSVRRRQTRSDSPRAAVLELIAAGRTNREDRQPAVHRREDPSPRTCPTSWASSRRGNRVEPWHRASNKPGLVSGRCRIGRLTELRISQVFAT